ncbi:MAG: hypothetical protein GQ535_03880 [Rhodobacteraceae bacterium]|nr:hypothetical protein [Paracoccaceae bacterium]
MCNEKSDYFQSGPLGVWRNSTAAGALRVLTGDDFIQLQLADYYESIATNYGRDFKNIRFISQYMPLFHDGPQHKRIRKMAAVHLRDAADDLKVFEQDAITLINATLRQEGPHELISELIIPIMHMISHAITKLDFYPGLIAILSGNNSLKATTKIDETFGKIYALSKERFPDETEEQRGIRIVFAALGSEPLGSTIARSFDTMFAGLENEKIAGLNWATDYPATGPGMAYRQCKHAPVNLGEAASAVKVFDVDLNPFLTDEGANCNHIFGVGAHACVGRGIALSLWARVREAMQDNPYKITHISSSRTTHKIFDYPSSIQIEVSK